MPVRTAGALVFPLLMIEQHNTFSFWNRLPNKFQDLLKYLFFIVLCHKMFVFPFLTLEQHTTVKESMIHRFLIGWKVRRHISSLTRTYVQDRSTKETKPLLCYDQV